jgi:hypothetical protein
MRGTTSWVVVLGSAVPMLTSALLLMLSFAQVDTAFLSDGAHRSVRLAEAATPPAPDLPSYVGWSRAQLQREYTRLKDERPGLGLPIALMSSGGGAAILLLYAALLGIAGARTSFSVPLVAVLAVMGIGGAAMVAIGGILLWRIIPERRPYSLQMDEVDRLLKDGAEQDRRPPVPDVPPPPPPAYAPQSSLQFPLIFARF